MKITLAMPYEGHRPDETIEVDDPTGRDLIRSGWAREPDPERPAPKPKSAKASTAKEPEPEVYMPGAGDDHT